MTKPRKPRWPERRMGPRSGYDVYQDGSISLAPMWADRIDAITDRECGLREMQHGITIYVTDQFTHLAREKKRWWDDVFAELGMERGTGDRWTYADGIVRKADPEPASDAVGEQRTDGESGSQNETGK